MTFPNLEDFPAQVVERSHIPCISILSFRNFWLPVFWASFWKLAEGMAAMSMPKASSHFDHFSLCGKYDVGLAGKVSSVKLIAVSDSLKHLTDVAFRFRVHAFDGPHVSAPPFVHARPRRTFGSVFIHQMSLGFARHLIRRS